MAIRYAQQFVGVVDGTKSPPDKLDGAIIGAKVRRVRADKQVVADQVGDQVYIGYLPQGSSPVEFRTTTDTALGNTTISIGSLANPTKYVNAKQVANTDVPTIIGPRTASLQQPTSTADEALYVTFGGAAVPGAALVTFTTEYTIST